MINLYPKTEFRFPITAECITPDNFQEKTLKEIKALKIWEGNKEKKLRELFKIEETKREDQPEETIVTIHGNVNRLRKIGAFMKAGEIRITGNAGMHLGEEMQGGRITVRGNVDGWAGSMLKDGTIRIQGNVGDYLGAPYRGSSKGMSGGEIIVHGNVGNDAGAHMSKGIIKIYGSAGQFLGFRMRNGTIYVEKNCKGRAGACMKNGKIIVGGSLKSILPSFTIQGIKKKAKIGKNEVVEEPFYLFLGDLTENGRGKLYASKKKNSHLSHYEKLI